MPCGAENCMMKDLLKRALVEEFRRAENQLLQVLLTQFKLRRTQTGACLEVGFSDETSKVWPRDGKAEVRRWMKGFTSHKDSVKRYQEEIDQFLNGGTVFEYIFNDPTFPFRYVSGGTLPVIRMGGADSEAVWHQRHG